MDFKFIKLENKILSVRSNNKLLIVALLLSFLKIVSADIQKNTPSDLILIPQRPPHPPPPPPPPPPPRPHDLTGHIELQENGDSDYVSTGNSTVAVAKIYNLPKPLINTPLKYVWSVNDLYIPGQNTSTFVYNFTNTTDQIIKVMVTATVDKKDYAGEFSRTVFPRDPVRVVDIKGKLFLEHGDMLNVSIIINGSKPYEFCYAIYPDEASAHSNTCKISGRTIDTTIPISRYIQKIGSSYMVFKVKNQVHLLDKFYTIKITDITPQPRLLFIIVPVVCSLSAILIVLSGVALHLRYRHHHLIEIADFDFTRNDTADQSILDRLLGGQNQSYHCING